MQAAHTRQPDVEEHDVYFLFVQRFHGFACVPVYACQLQLIDACQMIANDILGKYLIFYDDTFYQALAVFKINDTVNELLFKITSKV